MTAKCFYFEDEELEAQLEASLKNEGPGAIFLRESDPSTIDQVEEFHRTFNVPVMVVPLSPAKERAALRIALLREELDELEAAFAADDVTEIADALTDLQYVLDGAYLECGMQAYKPELFAEVHRSNMSKVAPDLDTAVATVRSLEDAGTPAYWDQRGPDQFLIYRQSDHKVMKALGYSKPNLKAIVELPF